MAPEVIAEIGQKAAAERSLVAEAEKAFEGMVLKGLHAKMAHIMATMPNMAPEGQNAHFRYKYWSTDQVTGYFRGQFGRMGISFIVSVEQYDIREHQTAKDGRSYLTTIIPRFTLTDWETGETISGLGIGQGDDPGDKGSNKALAGAIKYWLLKTFLMGGEDAEADESTDKRAEGGPRKAQNREERSVRIGPSDVEGIGRGGRPNKATTAQISQMRTLARDMGLNAYGTANLVSGLIGEELELPDEPEQQAGVLLRYLEGLSADDAGKIITRMVEQRDEQRDADRATELDAELASTGGYGS